MLMIVDELMNAIAANEGNTGGKPLPCEVFDVIGGIGVGGWIAILLGRLHLDIPTCIRAYVEIVNAVTARSWVEKRRLRWHNANFDQPRLLTKVSDIVKRYSKDTGDTGDKMLCHDTQWPRCQYTFAAAAEKGSSPSRKYQIFRTYPTPEGPQWPGPDAAECRIADAFAATAACKYLFNSFSLDHSSVKLFDADSMDPHAITLLAMDEITSLTSTPHPIQLAINIGSGASTERDFRSLAGFSRIFSFGTPLEKRGTLLRDTIARDLRQSTPKTKLEFVERLDIPRPEGASGASKQETDPHDDKLTEMAILLENKYHEDIDVALKEYYTQYHSGCLDLKPKYISLGPTVAPRNTVVNDVAAADTTYQATCAYIKRLRPQIDEKAAPLCCSDDALQGDWTGYVN
ncbi:hypothetical protein A1O3_00425 [Capronia epimyces CBS 606.96]|uniref:PNPLA domain-containing protein n=1 Tax=Capronia epimyces CBS 606.96 TaxID=1182542 RepID=W9YQG1_9EURO|nr:uncharacterized protein A1O3_00425 [Capronia epimyces CBS 606.96]EXJ91875.1 hypothetical protein A1O3_00425 [Capronia epimyces CBS 606.96]